MEKKIETVTFYGILLSKDSRYRPTGTVDLHIKRREMPVIKSHDGKNMGYEIWPGTRRRKSRSLEFIDNKFTTIRLRSERRLLQAMEKNKVFVNQIAHTHR